MMARFIDANNVKLKGISVFDQNLEILIPLSDVRKALQMTPTADVQEVKHAKNLQKCLKCAFECSLCHWCDDDTYCADTSEFKFCPNCGAKMDDNDFCSKGERRKEDVDA